MSRQQCVAVEGLWMGLAVSIAVSFYSIQTALIA